jgi:hypothetical protein
MCYSIIFDENSNEKISVYDCVTLKSGDGNSSSLMQSKQKEAFIAKISGFWRDATTGT